MAGAGLGLPSGKYEVELAIQDRQFDTERPVVLSGRRSCGPERHAAQSRDAPVLDSEFFGDAIVVNGKTWPYQSVEPRRYRFRILNGCNARFLKLKIARASSDRPGPSDLADRHRWRLARSAGRVGRSRKRRDGGLLLAPAERADIIIDFAAFAHETLLMLNTANAPYPSGDPPDPKTNGQIMQFRVDLPRRGKDTSFDPAAPRATLRGGKHQPPAIVRLTEPDRGTIARGVTISRRRQLHFNRGGRRWRPARGLGQQYQMGWQAGEQREIPFPISNQMGGNWISELPRDRLYRALGDRQPDRRRPSDAFASGSVPVAEPAERS